MEVKIHSRAFRALVKLVHGEVHKALVGALETYLKNSRKCLEANLKGGDEVQAMVTFMDLEGAMCRLTWKSTLWRLLKERVKRFRSTEQTLVPLAKEREPSQALQLPRAGGVVVKDSRLSDKVPS